MTIATLIELSDEEANYLGYTHNDKISMTKTEEGYIIFKKSKPLTKESDLNYYDFDSARC